MRQNSAALSGMMGLFIPSPITFLGTYLFYEGGNLLLILLMFLWDWKRAGIMKQFLAGHIALVAGGVEIPIPPPQKRCP